MSFYHTLTFISYYKTKPSNIYFTAVPEYCYISQLIDRLMVRYIWYSIAFVSFVRFKKFSKIQALIFFCFIFSSRSKILIPRGRE